MSIEFDFDLFVIGGGSGGVRAARIAASEHGARVAIAEESRMGGTCVIRGCVPKKLMVFASSAPDAAEEARGYGWLAEAGQFDWQVFRAKLHADLSRLELIYRAGLKNAGVTIYDQRAKLADAHTVELADGTRVSARHILVAAGGRPQLPGIEGEEHALISDDVFLLDKLPQRVLVVGGGFIACEFASIFKGLRCDATLNYRGDKVLRGFDGEMREAATNQLSEIGVRLHLGASPTRLEKTGDTVRVHFDDGSQADYDAVVMATGRAPYTRGLGLEQCGVRLAKNGAVVVDEWSQSSVPSIFAVGDVTDRVNLTPVAIREGHSFADTVFGNRPRKVDHSLIASAVFLRPHELGTIGLTEEEAALRDGPAEVYATQFRPMRSMFAGSDAKVAMKLIVDGGTRKVLGCHIFGPDAGEMIQLAAIAITMGATKEDFDATMAVHPTLAEELVTMRQPARWIGAGGLAA